MSNEELGWNDQESLFSMDEPEVDLESVGNQKDYIVSVSDTPKYGSKEWHEYIMARFEPEELFDGNPTCAGLRRLAEEELGPIVYSGPCEVFPSMSENGPGRATVVYEIQINWRGTGEIRTYKEVSDVWHGNTDDLFCAHPVATASTRAEGRALRKALKVRCLAAEELAKKDIVAIVRQTTKIEGVTNGAIGDKDKISSAQINFIENKCRQLDIDVCKLIGDVNINTLTKKTGSDLLAKLAAHQTGETLLPESFSGFKKNWR
jgi:hypothetical protein